MAQKNAAAFTGSIPEMYDRYLVPLQLEPFATDLVRRVPTTGLRDVLELASGTGLLTRLLRERLGEETRLMASDISEGMLKYAQTKPATSKKIEWKVADATTLPFKDASFDMVICQFGVMFFPDREKCAAEIFRVLRPGGRLLFNTWDRIEYNDFPRIVHDLVGEMFKGDPPAFYETPFSFHDHYEIRTLLRRAGFENVALTTVEMKVQATPENAAIALVKGNPIGTEIEQRLGKNLDEVVEQVRMAVSEELGSKMAKGHARALIVGGRKAGQLAANAKPTAAAAPQPKPAAKPKTATKAAAPKTVKAKSAAKGRAASKVVPKRKPVAKNPAT